MKGEKMKKAKSKTKKVIFTKKYALKLKNILLQTIIDKVTKQ